MQQPPSDTTARKSALLGISALAVAVLLTSVFSISGTIGLLLLPALLAPLALSIFGLRLGAAALKRHEASKGMAIFGVVTAAIAAVLSVGVLLIAAVFTVLIMRAFDGTDSSATLTALACAIPHKL